MHNTLKLIKTLLYSYSALHVSGTLAPIIRRCLILHIQPPVTMCRWVGCIFQLWSVTTIAKATVVTDQIRDAVDTVVCVPDDGWKYHPNINKLCDVACCWIYEYIGILLGARPILHISRIKLNIVDVLFDDATSC
jgi:hypothetical protein